MINLDRSAAMIKTQEMVDTLSPVELETIDRVLKRLNERLLLRNIDKEGAGAVATSLYRCGFTREDQLVDQLATALATPVATRSPASWSARA